MATTASSTSSTGESGTTAKKTRLLKDVEAEERQVLYNELYRSLHERDDAQLRRDAEEQDEGDDVLRQARNLKEELLQSATMPLAQKSRQCGQLLQLLGNARSAQAARVFVWVTCAMFTVPVLMLLIGMHVVAPYLHTDPVLCGSLASVATVLAIMVGYTTYALVEDKQQKGQEQQRAGKVRQTTGTEHKKKQ